MDRIDAGEVRTGAGYEDERLADRARLAASSAGLRVTMAPDLALVFETPETVRLALEEHLRAERIDGADRVLSEAAAFSSLLGDADDLAATLYVEVADPVALADRLAELRGVEGAVSLEVGGRRTTARSDPGEGGTGAFHLLFALDGEQWTALRAGEVATVRVDHPACRAAAATLAGHQLPPTGAQPAR